MKQNLQLSLKTKWFEMTKSRDKTEDYREITPYWCSRFLEYKGMKIKKANFYALMMLNDFEFMINFFKENYDFKEFTINTMTLGYPSKDDKERIIQFEHAGIEIREGREEWGAEKGKIYFVIKHGKRIS